MAKDDSDLFWQEGGFLPGFNVRCYGILIREERVLISKENFNGPELIKFPGGGIEFKEGPAETLKRELHEEIKIHVRVGECFYVSPYFHRSYFRQQQLIALYWRVFYDGAIDLPQDPTALSEDPKKTQQLFWQPLKKITSVAWTHPLDLEVAEQLDSQLNGRK